MARTRARSGHHPLGAWCNNTFESLAVKLRQGSAGSNTVADHIEVLDEAIAQIPAKHRRNLLITVDGAGASIDINKAWCLATTIAADLLCWLRLLCLDGELTTAEPKTLRYRLPHTAARIVRGQRTITIPETWPWAAQFASCLCAALTLPPPTRC